MGKQTKATREFKLIVMNDGYDSINNFCDEHNIPQSTITRGLNEGSLREEYMDIILSVVSEDSFPKVVKLFKYEKILRFKEIVKESGYDSIRDFCEQHNIPQSTILRELQGGILREEYMGRILRVIPKEFSQDVIDLFKYIPETEKAEVEEALA